MDTTHHQKLKENITKSQQIGIVVSKNPNLDQMAAGLGLYLALKSLGKSVAIASPSEPLVEISNLVGIDKVKRVLLGEGGDLVVSFPYRDGEIEKVSYNIDEKEGFLNIIVKAAEKGLQFQEKDILFKRGGKPLHLLFTIGVPKLSDVSEVLVNDPHKNAVVINIDNKATNERYGDVVIVSPDFSSLSEHIADFLTIPAAGMPIDVDIAQNLLQGITYATNDFQDPKTSHLAFEMAGILMRKGAVRYKKPLLSEDQRKAGVFTPRPQRPVQQPVQQPIQSQQQNSSPRINQQQPPQPVQPRVQQPVASPGVQSVPPALSTAPPPIQQPSQQQGEALQKQTPADWLQPKVYKGSTILQ